MVEPLQDLFLLDPDVVYLNHGSFGACPRPVFDVYQSFQRDLERNPMGFYGERQPELLTEARAALGSYLGVTGDDIVYFPNPTSAVRTLCASLKLGPGDEVLATNWEYPTLVNAFEHLAYMRGIRYCHQSVPVPMGDPEAWVDAYWAGVTPRTRILHLSHISFTTSLIHPVAEVCRRAREAGILTFVDGAHAVSQIPVDLAALDADIYVGACHKWLCAPKGSGFAYAHPRVQALLAEPHVRSRAGGPGAAIEPGAFVASYQYQGTRDSAAILSVPAAIAFQAEHDWEAQRERCRGLARQTVDRVTVLTGLEPVSPNDSRYHSQMVSIPVPDERGDAIAAAFRADNIVAVQVKANGLRMLRVSYQAYNSQDDADRYVAAVAKGLAGG
ncbi:MAG: aminotransferase class V-fold PLP-dependent enzyme [Anaerolineae bacterium]|nr:aminotransferase class V-fold PLP-dependent enzyme [Anaerolineae bacterium]